MEQQDVETPIPFILPEERARLVQFCTSITKNRDAAEDLTQETLVEAWRHEHALRDPHRRGAWLFGIARNVCLRWLRARERDTTRLIQPHPDQDTQLPDLDDTLADDLDIEIELERKELIELLGRALALLPAETRTVLIQRYVEESPLAEIAAELGTNASAVAMRLQRGKIILRRVLTQEMGQEIADYTPVAAKEQWETTPLWCYICGQHRLLGMRDPKEGKLLLKCPQCSPGAGETINQNALPVLKGIKGYRRLYTRLAAWCDNYYRTGLRAGSIACVLCGSTIPISIQTPEQFPRWLHNKKQVQTWMRYPDERVVIGLCENCASASITSLDGLVLESAEGQQFLQEHIRIRTLPQQHMEVDGRAAILTRFESLTSNARLNVISDNETYAVLRIYGESL